jgi:2-C-methyl-D-erythritol 2,4-cyclodiphosphate synthase
LDYRTGIGYDIHRLVEGRKLFLGGLQIDYAKGLLGHSDGDVVLHALCDALLGAAGLGDIGEYFPDNDPAYKDIYSRLLLERVNETLKEKGFEVLNVDMIILAQEPFLRDYKPRIRENIAAILGIEAGLVGVKAKTTEGLGDIGRKEAIAAYAVAALCRKR